MTVGSTTEPYSGRFHINLLMTGCNNRAEDAIWPFTVGHKSRLFSDSVKGAKASAIFCSLIAFTAVNGLNVEKYIVKLFKSGFPIRSVPWLTNNT